MGKRRRRPPVTTRRLTEEQRYELYGPVKPRRPKPKRDPRDPVRPKPEIIHVEGPATVFIDASRLWGGRGTGPRRLEAARSEAGGDLEVLWLRSCAVAGGIRKWCEQAGVEGRECASLAVARDRLDDAERAGRGVFAILLVADGDDLAARYSLHVPAELHRGAKFIPCKEWSGDGARMSARKKSVRGKMK